MDDLIFVIIFSSDKESKIYTSTGRRQDILSSFCSHKALSDIPALHVAKTRRPKHFHLVHLCLALLSLRHVNQRGHVQMRSSKLLGFLALPPPHFHLFYSRDQATSLPLAKPPPQSLMTSFVHGLKAFSMCLALLSLRHVDQSIFHFVQMWLISYIAWPWWILGTKSCQTYLYFQKRL